MLTIHLTHVESDAERRAAFAVMRELRPHLTDPEAFGARVRRQAVQGYPLLAARQGGPDGPIMALAGYRHQENPVRGRFVYIDDVVAASDALGSGLGRQLIDAVRDDARSGQRIPRARHRPRKCAGATLLLRQGLVSRAMRFSQAPQTQGQP